MNDLGVMRGQVVLHLWARLKTRGAEATDQLGWILDAALTVHADMIKKAIICALPSCPFVYGLNCLREELSI